MSIENAILELAAAIRYAADKTAGGTGRIASLIENVTCGGNALVTGTADTIEQDVAKVETDAKAAQQKAMNKVATGKAEIAAALEKAKAEKESKVTKEQLTEVLAEVREMEKSVAALEAAPLDWDKDVRPALLAVGKDRDALVKLMGKYEVPKGGKAPTEKWADLLAEANAIVAARG